MMMMMTINPFVILSIILAISVASAFSSSSNIIASRRSTPTSPTPYTTTIITSTGLFSTPFDIGDDSVSLHPHMKYNVTTINNNGGGTSLRLGLMKKTVSDAVAAKTTGSATTSSAATTSVSPVDVQEQEKEQIPTDSSTSSLVVMDAPKFPPENKIQILSSLSNLIKNNDNGSKNLKTRYAIVAARLMIICVSFLPLVRNHQMMHKEEFLIQLFLLAISMQPIKRSVTLVQCITSSETGVEECQLEFEDLEEAFDIKNNHK